MSVSDILEEIEATKRRVVEYEKLYEQYPKNKNIAHQLRMAKEKLNIFMLLGF